MIQLTSKINHRVSGLVIIVCLVFAVCVFGYYWLFINFQAAPENELIQKANAQATGIRAGRSQFFESVGALKRYGNWPIVDVPLSADRGNPFAPK